MLTKTSPAPWTAESGAVVYSRALLRNSHATRQTTQDAEWWQDYLRQNNEQYRLYSFWLGADVEGW